MRILVMLNVVLMVTGIGCTDQWIVVQDSENMAPTLHKGQALRVKSVPCNAINRFDIILLTDPEGRDAQYLMRVWGLPGESVKLGESSAHIKGEDITVEVFDLENLSISSRGSPMGSHEYREIQLDEGEFYVLGDNLGNSWDSRFFGPILCEQIVGKVISD